MYAAQKHGAWLCKLAHEFFLNQSDIVLPVLCYSLTHDIYGFHQCNTCSIVTNKKIFLLREFRWWVSFELRGKKGLKKKLDEGVKFPVN